MASTWLAMAIIKNKKLGWAEWGAYSVPQHICTWSACVSVCVCVLGGGGGWEGSWCPCVGGYMHRNLCVCQVILIHPNLHIYRLCECECVCVCVCACACVHVRECRWLRVRGCLSFSACQFSLCIVWPSTCSNVLLCYWFLCEYLHIPCFSLIKWQSDESYYMHTINSIFLLTLSLLYICWPLLPLSPDGCFSGPHPFPSLSLVGH